MISGTYGKNEKNGKIVKLGLRLTLFALLPFFHFSPESATAGGGVANGSGIQEAVTFYHKFPRMQAEQMAGQFSLTGREQKVFVRALRVWPLIRWYAAKFEVDPMIAFRVAATESLFQEREIGTAQEIGLFQILPSTGRMLWKWYQSSCPEPRVPWEHSVPNQICLAIKHLANIQQERGSRTTSLRAWKLPELYAVYNGGPTGLNGKRKKEWVLGNLKASKQWESVAYALDQVEVRVPVPR